MSEIHTHIRCKNTNTVAEIGDKAQFMADNPGCKFHTFVAGDEQASAKLVDATSEPAPEAKPAPAGKKVDASMTGGFEAKRPETTKDD